MMAMRRLTEGFQRLCLHPCLQSQAKQSQVQAGVVAIADVFTRSFQTSSTCWRVLDRKSYPKSILPSSKKGRWVEWAPIRDRYEYTVRPLPLPKTGGRGPNGRIWNHRRAGGHKRNYRMIDWHRGGPTEGEPLVERVEKILYDPNRSARIALVVSGEHKRYIIATQNMEPGQLIKSSQHLTDSTVKATEGDAYPLGSLPIGTLVNSVELYAGEGSFVARAAGTQAQILRRMGDRCTLRLPSKREVNVSAQCMGTVGRVSNIDHNQRVIGKAGRNRWLGFRPKSGRFKKKTGRFGRKAKRVKPVISYNQPKKKHSPMKPLPFHLTPPNVKRVYPI